MGSTGKHDLSSDMRNNVSWVPQLSRKGTGKLAARALLKAFILWY